MNPIQIHHVTIRQDSEGRYCLNDLYKASGGEKRNRPSYWLKNNQTTVLISELISEPEFRLRNDEPNTPQSEPEFRLAPVVTEAAGNPGTYVVKELVYAYAMWISPAFHLQVIRAYDALVIGELNQHTNYWFRIRPHWLSIRTLVLEGKTYGEVASLIGRSVGSIRRAVKRMVEVGLINPAILAQVQKGIARLHNLKRSQLWGQQLHLFG
jgi:hypothetical protein